MTGEQFKEWRKRMGFTQEVAAQMLHVSRITVARIEATSRLQEEVPRAIELACAAMTWGITSSNEAPDRSKRGDDRAYVLWAAKELERSDSELEKQARQTFPQVWQAYPYVMIARPEWDDPEVAKEVMERAKEAGSRAEWRVMPIARNEERGWELYVPAIITPTVNDLTFFILASH